MTAPIPTDAEQRVALWGPGLVVAFTVAALVLVGVDAEGPLRQVTTALAVIVAPGMAASFAMGPMSVPARALVSVVASTALLTVASMVMALLGSSSPTTGLWLSALVAFALILIPFARSGRSRAADPPAAAEKANSAVESIGDESDDVAHEDGEDG